MRKFLTLLAMLISIQAAFGDVRLVMVDGYCYLKGQSEHSETKVKFMKVSPSAVTDSTYTDSSGYFFVTDLYEGIYDIEYTHTDFDTERVEDQVLVGSTTLPPVTLVCTGIDLSGSLSGALGPGCYRIIADISISSGDSLRLLPGTTFVFAGPYFFRIYGTLLAEGTESDPIIFTTDTVLYPNRWRGLRFSGTASSGSQLAYCLIEKGYATGSFPDFCGGGVYCQSSSPTFTTCTISGNSTDYYGGGVAFYGTPSPTLTTCTISGNSATYNGGGVWCYYSSPTFMNCTISGNWTGYFGGGVYCHDSSPTLTTCTISGNSATYNDGGVSCWNNSSPVFNSTVIAFSIGSGIYFESSAGSQISYCDVFGNSAGNFAFYNNDPSNGPLIIGRLVTTNINGDSCDTYFDIFLDPMFADTAAGDFHLTDFSHCIGAGDPADTVSTDFEGDPRPNPSWSFPDIGADEHWSGSPVLHLVVSMVSSNAVLHWTPFGAGPYYIYGATLPFTAGTLLATVSDATTWTDEETASRPSRYFYYVMAEWPGR